MIVRRHQTREYVKQEDVGSAKVKTYKEFISETKQLEESKVALAKQAFKSFSKFAKKTPILKKVTKLFTKKPPRSIDPYFAQKAFEKGTMVPGYHGQSLKNITQYKKTGVTPTVSGLKVDPMVQYKNNPATLKWIERTGYKGTKRSQNMARPGIDAYYADKTDAGLKRATQYKNRGAAYENQKLKNILNPIKDKGEVMDVAVNKRSVRSGWKGTDGKFDNPGDASERIAKAQDIIPIVPGPSSKVGKYRLVQQLRKDRLKYDQLSRNA